MGDLIHDRKQKSLPWQSHRTVCRRCKGSKTVYYASMRSGAEVIGGRRMACPDCGGTGTVREPDHPSACSADAGGDPNSAAGADPAGALTGATVRGDRWRHGRCGS
jgi:hypothetical protein